MAKIDRILQTLETRISRGDYAMTLFPTEHGLADEMSVGRMTARRAILRLVEKGLLCRDNSGRLSVTSVRSAERPLQIALVTCSQSPPAVWHQAAQAAVEERGGHLRIVTFRHWDDPTLLEAVESFDGVLLIPPAESLPSLLCERLLKSRARIATLGADFSGHGLHGVDVVSPCSVDALLNHLAQLGHRDISVLNSQPVVADIENRLNQWQSWISSHGFGGQLINEPEISYGKPMERAYLEAQKRLASGEGLGGTAVLCTTLPAALGLMRAANEAGLRIGYDLSICTVNDEGIGAFLTPTLTSTRMTDPRAMVGDCIDWMSGGQWQGALLHRSEEVELFIGASTGPEPKFAAEKSGLLRFTVGVGAHY